jgi:DNA-binding CsgD family transcriptional regulator
MPPYAICLTDPCDYLFDFRANDDVPPRFPPHRCPTCANRVIFYCPSCRWPILTVPNLAKPCCGHCDTGLRIVQDTHTQGVSLSSRELEVLRLLAVGKCYKEVESDLGISMKTVEQYRWRLMRKTNARSLVHLAHYAIQHQIVEIQDCQVNPSTRRQE